MIELQGKVSSAWFPQDREKANKFFQYYYDIFKYVKKVIYVIHVILFFY